MHIEAEWLTMHLFVYRFLSQGVKDVILLGQNVNSYRDTSETSFSLYGQRQGPTVLSEGFRTIYKTKQGGLRFAELLDRVAEVRVGNNGEGDDMR